MGILSFCYFRMSNLIKLMSANRILISSNTISYIVDNIFISLHIEMLFYVANIRVIRWKHHLQCSILQLCLGKRYPTLAGRLSSMLDTSTLPPPNLDTFAIG